MSAEIWQIAARRRLRMVVLPVASHCPAPGCRARLDDHGDHLANCSRCGNLQRRAKPTERAWQRIFQEAGARVQTQALLCDCGLGIASHDRRRIDLVARGLPLFGGLPIFGDASLVSAVHGDGTSWAGAARRDGVALERARRVHEDTYAEICSSDRAKLVILGSELEGRLSPDALTILRKLSAAKARQAPELLQRSVQFAWHSRWLNLLSITVQVAVAESLLRPGTTSTAERDGPCPHLLEPLVDRSLDPPSFSRLPLR